MLAILAFLVTIGILVVVHEYGHYLFARIFNVKVLTFSIGFGPKLLSFTSKSNEWRLGIIPFGGYVRMLDEREGIVQQDEKHLAFNNKPPYQKILIAFAGPLFNILFAILLYYIIGLVGVSQVKPVISSINSQLLQNTIKSEISVPAQIMLIDGYQPKSWDDAENKFKQSVMHQAQFSLQFRSLINSDIQTITLNTAILKQHFSTGVYLENLGLYPIAYLPVIAYIEPHSVADKSGLKVNDKILAINSRPISNWFQIADEIHSAPGVKLRLTINRDGRQLDYNIIPATINDSDGELAGKLGIMPLIDQKMLEQNSFIQKYDKVSAINYAVSECYNLIRFNLLSIYQIITGQMSLYNLGGPITIAKVGGVAIHDGLLQFAEFLALISIGLAIMNLLPIPVLDGGHILIYLIELIINKQLAYSIQMFIFKLGFIFVIGLSFFAVYNDMMRL